MKFLFNIQQLLQPWSRPMLSSNIIFEGSSSSYHTWKKVIKEKNVNIGASSLTKQTKLLQKVSK
jgi:hypothetical protein